MEADALEAQIDAVLAVLREAMPGPVIEGVFLYGSAMRGGLRPASDVDLLAVVARHLTPFEKAALIRGLLPISGGDGRPAGWRPVELSVVARPDVKPWRYPPPLEVQYGEWWRADYLAGDLAPWRTPNPDLAVLITMVRAEGRPLFGPAPDELLDPVPADDLRRAIVDELEPLVAELEDDTRNVLLTLARMWCTVETGEIRSKDAAAAWAIERMRVEDRPVLTRARDLYLDGGDGDWGDLMHACRDVAAFFVGQIRTAAQRR